MSDSEAQFHALQGRIAAAIERIGQAAEGREVKREAPPPEPAIDPEEVEALRRDLAEAQAALEDEKLASAQLQERLNTLTERQEKSRQDADAAVADQKAAMETLDHDLQRLRMANDQLREMNEALREASRTGVEEPHLINKSMLAELEALRASRAADRSEAEAIIAALTPLVANSSAPVDADPAPAAAKGEH